MNKIDLIAKLLANENIDVVKAAVKTASFNIETRLLKLPILKDVTDEIEHMLVSHEIGHALFTNQELVDASINNRKLHSYLNVIEDVRIEKLVKRKYPGTKKIFIEGYKQLNERNFFRLDRIPDINKLGLIDKINMYYKLGSSFKIEFNEVEQEFADRAAKTETPADVIKLATEIFDYAKQQKKEEKEEEEQQEQEEEQQEEIPEEENQNQSGLDDESEEQESDESEEDDEADSTENDDDGSEEEEFEEEDDEDLESVTDGAFNDSLNDIVDDTISYEYHTFDKEYDKEYMVGYKQILGELSLTASDNMLDRYYNWKPLNEEFNKFKENALKSVIYLLKEFEMKKAATAYSRTSVSKSGSLDMKKIWGYQLNDDLFKRVTTVANGKNHGMVFLLDWSGSMNTVIHDAIEQVITLSMFCQRAQIPYQVFAFTDKYNCGARLRDRNWNTKHNIIDNADSSSLLELFSNKMSSSEFNLMSKLLFNTYNVTNTPKYKLGGTPLNNALVYMTDYIGKFIRNNNVEKTSFITLTDGQGSSLSSSLRYQDTYAYRRANNYITDTTTKKVYPFSMDSTEQTSTILQMIKDRYNTSNIGFYISNSSNQKDISTALYYNGIPAYGSDDIRDDIRKEIKDKGFASIDSKGRDKLFLVPTKSLKIEDKELEINTKSSTKAIANKISKNLQSQQVNRLLLNNFVKLIA